MVTREEKLAAALRTMIDVGTHPRGCRSLHVDKRRKDVDQFGFGPCDCGYQDALKQAAEALGTEAT